MTGKTNSPAERRGRVWVSSHGPDLVGFDPSFTPDPKAELYDETLRPGNIERVRARSFWGAVLEKAGEWIGNKAKEIGRDFVSPRTGETAYAYAREGVASTSEHSGAYSGADFLPGPYSVKPAKLSWLQRVTDNVGEYVFGAAVPDGEDEGIYIHDDLLGDAWEYICSYSKGLFEKAKSYASDFIQALLTKEHEIAHYELGISDEGDAERYAVDSVRRIGEYDRAVEFALEQAGTLKPVPVYT